MKIKQQPTLSYTVFHHFWLLSDLKMTPFPLYFHCIRHWIILIMDGVSWLRLIEVLATVFLLCNQTIFSFFGKLLFFGIGLAKQATVVLHDGKIVSSKLTLREDSKVLKYLFHDPILYKKYFTRLTRHQGRPAKISKNDFWPLTFFPCFPFCLFHLKVDFVFQSWPRCWPKGISRL